MKKIALSLLLITLMACGDGNYMDRDTTDPYKYPPQCAEEEKEWGDSTQANRTEGLLRCHIRIEEKRLEMLEEKLREL